MNPRFSASCGTVGVTERDEWIHVGVGFAGLPIVGNFREEGGDELIAADALFQSRGVELGRAADLGDGEDDTAQAGLAGLWFETVGVAQAGVGALARPRLERVGTLFAGIDLGVEAVPDATTRLHFRHLREAHAQTARLLAEVNALLSERQWLLRAGTLVDATILAAPSSTKNQQGARDPEPERR